MIVIVIVIIIFITIDKSAPYPGMRLIIIIDFIIKNISYNTDDFFKILG